MTVVSTDVDREALSLTMVCEFDAAPDRVWRLWSDPRQLERWWGPPGWPATVTAHEFTAGGRIDYHMTGPEGEISAAWMRVTALDAPHFIHLEEGFSHDDGRDNPSMPLSECAVRFEALDDASTRMTVVFRYSSLADLDLVVGMGMVEGLTAAAGQIEGVLATAA